MGEQILAAIIRSDEPEALGVVEPLHGTCRHFQLPSLSIVRRNPAGNGQRIGKGIDCHFGDRRKAVWEGKTETSLVGSCTDIIPHTSMAFMLRM
jgi:hypothetical protein